MASPRPPPPLPLIKERTRALQQKLRQRATQANLNTSSSSSHSDQSQQPFHVVHSVEPPTASTTTEPPVPTPAATSALQSAADTAIARLRTYRDEQLQWHTAVEHRSRRVLHAAVAGWRRVVHAHAGQQLNSAADQLARQHTVRRQRAAIHHWKAAARASKQHSQQHGRLAHFYGRHLQRVCLLGWVAHTLRRADKEVGALLAQSLYRSNTVRAVWRLWRETASIAAHQQRAVRRAQQHADSQLTEQALSIWRAQSSRAAAQREKERSAALLGDRRSKQYYMQRWRQLPGTVRNDERAAPRIMQRASQQLTSDSWQAWRAESEWRRAAQVACDRLAMWRQQWAVRAACVGWEGIVQDEAADEERRQQADAWHSRRSQHCAVQWWRVSNQDTKAQRVLHKRMQLSLRQSLQRWRHWARQQRLSEQAQRQYDSSSAAHAFHWWRQQLQWSVDDRQMRETARAHEYESRMLSALVLWRCNAEDKRHSRERIAAADSSSRYRLLQDGLFALSSNCHKRHAERQQASLARRHQLQSAVALLSQHAAYQRHCWQQHLRAKRWRYFHLLRQGWHGWHEARREEAAADERLFAERCGGLVREWTRQLFGAWLRATTEQRGARERGVVALTQWRGRLLVETWQEWQMAMLDRVDEQQRFRVADDFVHRSSRRHALTSWLSHARSERQLREAEGEAVTMGRQQLELLAQRRTWRHLKLAFHSSRAYRFDLASADQHHNSRGLRHSLHTWHAHSSASARRKHICSAAAATHARRLLLLAWQHWQAIQNERRRLLALHVRAMQWRKVREERRVWQGWTRWVHSRRARRQREADMRRLRVERLQVEGVRQWVMVGLDWIQQKVELELEARRAQQRREQEQAQQQQARREAVARWVQRIADHWRHRAAKKEEAKRPLVTQTQLTRWRETERERRRPKQLERGEEQPASVSFSQEQQSHSATNAAFETASAPSSVLCASRLSSSAVPLSVSSRRSRVRAEPRRHVELLLDEPLDSLPALSLLSAADALPLSTSAASHGQPSNARPHSSQSHSAAPRHSQPAAPAPEVDDALLAALSAPTSSEQRLDLAAAESRLHFLAGLRSAYTANQHELRRLQETRGGSSSTRLGDGGEWIDPATAAARQALLLQACLDFEQQRVEWKREVQQWQSTLRHAQMSN